jgi:hypothetical protein
VYDYIGRAMPFNAPGTLRPDELYAATAYVLFMNGIIPENAKLDADTLPKVQMPEPGRFYRTGPPAGREKYCLLEGL